MEFVTPVVTKGLTDFPAEDWAHFAQFVNSNFKGQSLWLLIL